jgi:predicted enzyme involved in methoxymalonyl-ACP biosynthesis
MTNASVIRHMPVETLLQKHRRLRRELLQEPQLQNVRIAVLGGVTTNEVVSLLEVLLLAERFRPTFYQSEYNRYYEDAILEPERIREFGPDIVYLHTHYKNIQQFPPVACSEGQFQKLLESEIERFRNIWNSIHETVGCQIIQNNFEHPPFPVLGNLPHYLESN